MGELFIIGIDLFSGLFTLVVGGGVIAIIYMYIVDKRQHTHAIRHNYPVIGRFRYLFEKQGEFLGSTFLRWTEKRCLLIELSEAGFIRPRKM